jgi:hypothetical protein
LLHHMDITQVLNVVGIVEVPDFIEVADEVVHKGVAEEDT